MSGTLISSLAWVPRGRAALQPRKYELDESEIERVGKLGGPGVIEQIKEQMMEMEQDDGEWEDMGDDAGDDDGDEDEQRNEEMMDEDEVKPSDPNDMSAYKMDEYDDEVSGAMGAFANVKGLSYYRTNDDDPYITLKEDDAEMEREELALLATDSMIVTARTTADLSGLDFHVYDDTNETMYPHHDLMLPAFPLCVEWLDFASGSSDSSKTGNFVAVGSFDPSIEIWDCDVVDGLYPQAILGPAGSLEKPVAKPKGTGKKKRKQIVQPTANPDHHVQPVLTLSWTPRFRNLLLSGSADATVKLWDLTRESPMGAQSSWDKIHGGEKVQAVEWNRGPMGSGADSAILSGGWDRTVRVWDAKSKDGEGYSVAVGADIECVRWDPWDSTSFYVSLENGLILAYDARTMGAKPTQAKFTLSAHDGAASALDINPHVRGCILTAGMDKQVKIWNVSDDESEGTTGRKREVSLVAHRDLGLGKVFAARWSPDTETPLALAAAGSKATLQVWDAASNAGIRKAFGERLRRAGREMGAVKESGGVVLVNDGGPDEED
ncbi:hypothetical protein CspHIS471_0406020 [Cutaneotrichosporon sp. HIS471]|nr:hypothetical protein CspHIS471_0406020 [Cutaneotrichosporon sp. HIS471]